MVLQHNDRAKTEPRASTFWLGEKSRKVLKMNKSPSSTVKKTCILTHTHMYICTFFPKNNLYRVHEFSPKPFKRHYNQNN